MTRQTKKCAASAVLAFAGAAALAVESGSGVYLLGSKDPGAGLAPPPGIYFSSDNYFYSDDDETNEALPGDGNSITIGTDADAFSSINTLLWAPGKRFLGGKGGSVSVCPSSIKTWMPARC